ncbi:MAG: hypothetical protein R6U88_02500 [Candidatus Bipolaricaulota bacterium]
MQVTLYYSDEDQYLMDLVDQKALRERKSRSSVVLSILEEHFEQGKRIGEILMDLGSLRARELKAALERQRSGDKNRQLGEILVEEGLVDDSEVDRALTIQGRFRTQS